MKILILHNRYSRVGGEEGVVAFQRRLLEKHGHTVLLYERSYDEIRLWRGGRFTSLFSALYNRRSVQQVRELVRRERPEVAIVHNLFPVISPAVLPVLKAEGVRVLMTLHNYRLVCPTGICYSQGEVCERCGERRGREWNCLVRRCERSVAGSFGYALRGWWSRWRGCFSEHVDCFLALSDFQRDLLSRYAGIPRERFVVLPNAIDTEEMPQPLHKVTTRDYVAYAGRLSPEKGIDTLFEAARLLPDLTFRVAGVVAEGYVLPSVPPNVELLGQLDRQGIADLYGGALAAVMTSRWYEGFPLAAVEAMYYGAPLVLPTVGGLPEIVDNGRCGELYPAGSAAGLSEALQRLRQDPSRANRLAREACGRLNDCYSAERYYDRLIAAASGKTQ